MNRPNKTDNSGGAANRQSGLVPAVRMNNGFDLVGGRLLSVADGPAAQFMYENAAGTRITLFAVCSDNSQMAEFTFKQNGKTNSFYWQDDRLRYAIVGDLPREELSKLAIRVFEAFS